MISPTLFFQVLRHRAVLTPVLVLGSLSGYADSSTTPQAVLDWYPREALTPEQQATMGPGCCGAYVDPLATKTQTSATEASDTIRISGEESQITQHSTVMSGRVELFQGQRQLTGDRAEIFNEPRSITLEGNVTYRETGFLLEGQKATMDPERSQFTIDTARYVIHEEHVHGEAQRVERTEEGDLLLEGSTYTYCEPGDPVWKLRSQTMMLDMEDQQGSATHVRLEMGDWPVFYFPYLRFPLGKQRQSGFLMPSLTSGEDGLDLSIPYYFNLAPHYDLTLTPRVIAERGSQLGGEFRHLHPYFNSSLSAAWLPDDRLAEEDRWLMSFNQEGGARQPWSTRMRYSRVSDVDYFEDLDSAGLSVSQQTHLKQYASAGYMTDHWDTLIEVESFQTLREDQSIEDPYKKLPSLSADGNYFLTAGLEANLQQRLARFESTQAGQRSGNRLAADYSLSWRNASQALRISPAAHLHYRGQQLDSSTGDETPEVLVPGLTLDSVMTLDQRSANYLHTLEPRLFYVYTDYENQDDFEIFDSDEISFDYDQLYETRRFSGDDRVGDNHQTTLGLLYRASRSADSSEWMHFGVGQTFYHDDRRVNGFDSTTFSALPTEYLEQYTANQSPLALQWQWNFLPGWQLDSGLAWDEREGQTTSGEAFLHYRSPEKVLFTAGYHHRRLLTQRNATTYLMETIRQAHLSTYWPLDDQWTFMGAVRYDFAQLRGLENMAGFQYEDCCWRLRTLYRQWKSNPDEVVDTDLHEQEHGIYIEIQFKGLASTGKQIQSLLDENVHGYSSSP